MTKKNPPVAAGGVNTTGQADDGILTAAGDIPVTTAAAVSSQQVSWWSVHTFVEPVLARIGSWPMVGSPAWCALPDGDPGKIAAIFSAAEHHALRVETAQEAECEASSAISAAADWRGIAQQTKDRAEFRAEHPWVRRVSRVLTTTRGGGQGWPTPTRRFGWRLGATMPGSTSPPRCVTRWPAVSSLNWRVSY